MIPKITPPRPKGTNTRDVTVNCSARRAWLLTAIALVGASLLTTPLVQGQGVPVGDLIGAWQKGGLKIQVNKMEGDPGALKINVQQNLLPPKDNTEREWTGEYKSSKVRLTIKADLDDWISYYIEQERVELSDEDKTELKAAVQQLLDDKDKNKGQGQVEWHIDLTMQETFVNPTRHGRTARAERYVRGHCNLTGIAEWYGTPHLQIQHNKAGSEWKVEAIDRGKTRTANLGKVTYKLSQPVSWMKFIWASGPPSELESFGEGVLSKANTCMIEQGAMADYGQFSAALFQGMFAGAGVAGAEAETIVGKVGQKMLEKIVTEGVKGNEVGAKAFAEVLAEVGSGALLEHFIEFPTGPVSGAIGDKAGEVVEGLKDKFKKQDEIDAFLKKQCRFVQKQIDPKKCAEKVAGLVMVDTFEGQAQVTLLIPITDKDPANWPWAIVTCQGGGLNTTGSAKAVKVNYACSLIDFGKRN